MTRGDDRRDRRQDRRDDRQDRRRGNDSDDEEDEDISRATSIYEKYVQPTLGEFIGTLMFTFIAGVAVTTMNVSMIAHAEGLALAFLCIAFRNLSGGQLNPATTIATVISGGVKPVLALLFIMAQMIGGMIGAAFVKACVLNDSYHDIKGGANQYRGLVSYNVHDSSDQVFMTKVTACVIECILSILVYMVYLMAVRDGKTQQSTGPIAYGFAQVACVTAGYHSCGASFNPARSFGCSVVSGYWGEQYIYWAGDMIGAAFAGLFYKLILGDRKGRIIMRH